MNDNYQIYETDYEEYLLNNGLRSLDNEIEQAVKNKKVNYFVVKKNNKLYTDFTLDTHNHNLISLPKNYLKEKALIDAILTSLNNYEYLSTYLFYENYDTKEYNFIKDNYQILKEITLTQGIANYKQVLFKK